MGRAVALAVILSNCCKCGSPAVAMMGGVDVDTAESASLTAGALVLFLLCSLVAGLCLFLLTEGAFVVGESRSVWACVSSVGALLAETFTWLLSDVWGGGEIRVSWVWEGFLPAFLRLLRRPFSFSFCVFRTLKEAFLSTSRTIVLPSFLSDSRGGAAPRGIAFRGSAGLFSLGVGTVGEAELSFLFFFLHSLSPLTFHLVLLTLGLRVAAAPGPMLGCFPASLPMLCCWGCETLVAVTVVGTKMSVAFTGSSLGWGTVFLLSLCFSGFVFFLFVDTGVRQGISVLVSGFFSVAGVDAMETVSSSVAGSSFMTSFNGSSFLTGSHSVIMCLPKGLCLCDALMKVLWPSTSPLLPEVEAAIPLSTLLSISAFCFLFLLPFPFPFCFLLLFFFPVFFLFFFFSELCVSPLLEPAVELWEVDTVARTLMKSSAAVTTFLSEGSSGPEIVDCGLLAMSSFSSFFLPFVFLAEGNGSSSMMSMPP